MNEQIEIAKKALEVLTATEFSAKTKKEYRVWNSRVYLRKNKGFITVKPDGSIDTSSVDGIAYAKTVAEELRAAGLNVPEHAVIGFGGNVKI